MAKRTVIFHQRPGYEAAFQAAASAVTAVAMGETVHVVLAFDALRAWCEGRYGEPDDTRGPDGDSARRGASLGVLPPKEMLSEARSLGVKLWACDTTVKLCGLEPLAGETLDEVVGLASIWRLTDGATVLSI